MPDMDGMEACRIIRNFEEETGRTPIQIVALTAHVMPGDREKFMTHGMNSYLTKPLKKQALVDEISRIVETIEIEANSGPLKDTG